MDVFANGIADSVGYGFSEAIEACEHMEGTATKHVSTAPKAGEAHVFPAGYVKKKKKEDNMRISDFKVGQTVFITANDRKQKGTPQLRETEVTKVGRKYLTITGDIQFEENPNNGPYLTEREECGKPRRLFLSQEAAKEYFEEEALKAWVYMAASGYQIDGYSIAQLREVKRILEGGEPKTHIYAKTTMETMPGSCTECAFGRRYGCVGDVECRILRKYFTGNVEPPYKERPDECPLVEKPAEPTP